MGKMVSYMGQLENKSEKEITELTINDIWLHGTGYHDINGEFVSTGNYEMELTGYRTGFKGNYYAYIERIRYKNRTTKGWNIRLYLSVFYTNSQDFLLLETDVKTLKEAKRLIVKKIIEVNNSKEKEAFLTKWKKEKATSVFTVDTKGKPLLIGTSYVGAAVENRNLKGELWFNNDMPNYTNCETVYELKKSLGDTPKLYINRTKFFGIDGYSSGGYYNKKLLEELKNIVKENKRYKHLFTD